MKHAKHIRIVLIPGYLDNLNEVRKIWTDIPEFETYNFASNLALDLQERVFQTDKDLRKHIIANFDKINYLNPRKIGEIEILRLPNFYEKVFLGYVSLDYSFLTYCEVSTVGDLAEEINFDVGDVNFAIDPTEAIRFEITDFEEFMDISNYDTSNLYMLLPNSIKKFDDDDDNDDLPL